ncbi:MAG: hypothetical protein U0517_02855 [Candidatus Andersenbacteria bacterium]
MVYLKEEYKRAIFLRSKGKTFTEIKKQVLVSKGTLSLWLRDVPMASRFEKKISSRKRKALHFARVKAAAWHRRQKELRLMVADEQAKATLNQIDLTHVPTLELALALLYLGEGFKKVPQTGLGNTDVSVLRIFVQLLKSCYGILPAELNCQLHLRYDQNELREKKYWSKALGIPLVKFKFTAFDKRTKNSKTYKGYHGVCAIRVRDIAIQRRLVSIGKQFAGLANTRA